MADLWTVPDEDQMATDFVRIFGGASVYRFLLGKEAALPKFSQHGVLMPHCSGILSPI